MDKVREMGSRKDVLVFGVLVIENAGGRWLGVEG